MKYSMSQCVGALQTADEEIEGSVSQRSYADWRNCRDGIPTVATIQRKFGSWNAGKSESGLETTIHEYNINKEYFKSIDEQNKAYWIGFILGDGFVTKRSDGTERWTLGIEIWEKDRALLEQFKEDTGAENPIYERTRDSSKHALVSIELNQKDFVKNLLNHGIKRQKSKESTLPDVPEQYHPDLVRGLHDADGHLKYHIGGSRSLEFTNDYQRLESLREIIPQTNGKLDRRNQDNRECDTASLYIRRSDGVEKMLNWMYPDGKQTSRYLKRKSPYE